MKCNSILIVRLEFQTLQIESIIVSVFTSVFCGVFIFSAIYEIREWLNHDE